jgi:hypothetical protein
MMLTVVTIARSVHRRSPGRRHAAGSVPLPHSARLRGTRAHTSLSPTVNTTTRRNDSSRHQCCITRKFVTGCVAARPRDRRGYADRVAGRPSTATRVIYAGHSIFCVPCHRPCHDRAGRASATDATVSARSDLLQSIHSKGYMQPGLDSSRAEVLLWPRSLE